MEYQRQLANSAGHWTSTHQQNDQSGGDHWVSDKMGDELILTLWLPVRTQEGRRGAREHFQPISQPIHPGRKPPSSSPNKTLQFAVGWGKEGSQTPTSTRHKAGKEQDSKIFVQNHHYFKDCAAAPWNESSQTVLAVLLRTHHSRLRSL